VTNEEWCSLIVILGKPLLRGEEPALRERSRPNGIRASRARRRVVCAASIARLARFVVRLILLPTIDSPVRYLREMYVQRYIAGCICLPCVNG
jgi:hypothetical protein